MDEILFHVIFTFTFTKRQTLQFVSLQLNGSKIFEAQINIKADTEIIQPPITQLLSA